MIRSACAMRISSDEAAKRIVVSPKTSRRVASRVASGVTPSPWRQPGTSRLVAARSSSRMRSGAAVRSAVWISCAITSDPLPWPKAARGSPPTPGGRREKKRLTSAPERPRSPASARATPLTLTRSSRPSPAAWSSSPAMTAWRRVLFPSAFEPATAKTSRRLIPSPVTTLPLPASSTSTGSSSCGHRKGTCTPSFGPAIRW